MWLRRSSACRGDLTSIPQPCEVQPSKRGIAAIQGTLTDRTRQQRFRPSTSAFSDSVRSHGIARSTSASSRLGRPAAPAADERVAANLLARRRPVGRSPCSRGRELVRSVACRVVCGLSDQANGCVSLVRPHAFSLVANERVLTDPGSNGRGRGTSGRTAGIQARAPTGSLSDLRTEAIERQLFSPDSPAAPWVYPAGAEGQCETRRLGRERPAASNSAAHRSISGRTQSMHLPRPRLTTGRGMSA